MNAPHPRSVLSKVSSGGSPKEVVEAFSGNSEVIPTKATVHSRNACEPMPEVKSSDKDLSTPLLEAEPIGMLQSATKAPSGNDCDSSIVTVAGTPDPAPLPSEGAAGLATNYPVGNAEPKKHKKTSRGGRRGRNQSTSLPLSLLDSLNGHSEDSFEERAALRLEGVAGAVVVHKSWNDTIKDKNFRAALREEHSEKRAPLILEGAEGAAGVHKSWNDITKDSNFRAVLKGGRRCSKTIDPQLEPPETNSLHEPVDQPFERITFEEPAPLTLEGGASSAEIRPSLNDPVTVTEN